MIVGDFKVVAGLGTFFIYHLLKKHYGGQGHYECPYTNEYIGGRDAYYINPVTFRIKRLELSNPDNDQLGLNIRLVCRDFDTHQYVRYLGVIKSFTGVWLRAHYWNPNLYQDGTLATQLISKKECVDYRDVVKSFNKKHGVYVTPYSRLSLKTLDRYGIRNYEQGLIRELKRWVPLRSKDHQEALQVWDNHKKNNPDYIEIDYKPFHFDNKPSGTVLDLYFNEVNKYRQKNIELIIEPWKKLLT